MIKLLTVFALFCAIAGLYAWSTGNFPLLLVCVFGCGFALYWGPILAWFKGKP